MPAVEVFLCCLDSIYHMTLFFHKRVIAMALVWQYGEKSGFESWKGLSWGMVNYATLSCVFDFVCVEIHALLHLQMYFVP